MTGTREVQFSLILPQEITDSMIDDMKTAMVTELATLMERIELKRLYESDKEVVDTKIDTVKSNLPKKSPIITSNA